MFEVEGADGRTRFIEIDGIAAKAAGIRNIFLVPSGGEKPRAIPVSSRPLHQALWRMARGARLVSRVIRSSSFPRISVWTPT